MRLFSLVSEGHSPRSPPLLPSTSLRATARLLSFLNAHAQTINTTPLHFASPPLNLLSHDTMTALVSSIRPLPVDFAITERSRRFYDGTYKWDSDGFTDDNGGTKREMTRELLLICLQCTASMTAWIHLPALPRLCLPCSSSTTRTTTAS